MGFQVTTIQVQGGYESHDVSIVRYNGEKFQEIFSKGLFLREPSPHPYCFDNSYEFVKNESDSSLYDIVFHINTQNDQEFLEFEGDDRVVDEPRKEDIVYYFNGKEYVEQNNKGVELTNVSGLTK